MPHAFSTSRSGHKRLAGRTMAAAMLLFLAVLSGCGVPGTIASGGSLPTAGPPSTPAPLPPVRFPQDEAPHHDLTEWWYYTGHMVAVDANGATREYGFELTFFQTLRGGLAPYYAAHFAISDITRGQFSYDQREGFEPASVLPAPGSTAGFSLNLDGWTAKGLDGHDHLNASMSNYAFDVSLTATKPAVLHGGNGIISYGNAGFSYYYSRTRIALRGTIQDHSAQLAVTGQAWMDHQWGNFVSLAGSGWDWYSIQLSDNAEFMLYVIRDAQKRPLATFGTYVPASGEAVEIASTAIASQPISTWTSPVTHGVYPSGWNVIVATQQATLRLTPLLLDQELVTAQSTGVAYWEGAVSVAGTLGGAPISGEGYVELTGYATIVPSSTGASIP
jgi:predicted secreted hydrolase